MNLLFWRKKKPQSAATASSEPAIPEGDLAKAFEPENVELIRHLIEYEEDIFEQQMLKGSEINFQVHKYGTSFGSNFSFYYKGIQVFHGLMRSSNGQAKLVKFRKSPENQLVENPALFFQVIKEHKLFKDEEKRRVEGERLAKLTELRDRTALL